MTSGSLRGHRLLLREPVTTDTREGGPYHRWMNDPEIIRFLESRFSDYSSDEPARFPDGSDSPVSDPPPGN